MSNLKRLRLSSYGQNYQKKSYKIGTREHCQNSQKKSYKICTREHWTIE